MTTDFQPNISKYFSKEGVKEVKSELEERKRQIELSRDILAKNIILPAMARFQFAEYVEIDLEGNVAYKKLDDLVSDDWEFFSYALPSPRVLSRELRACKLYEKNYDSFLKKKFSEFLENGLIEKNVLKHEINLEREGNVYQENHAFGEIQILVMLYQARQK